MKMISKELQDTYQQTSANTVKEWKLSIIGTYSEIKEIGDVIIAHCSKKVSPRSGRWIAEKEETK